MADFRGIKMEFKIIRKSNYTTEDIINELIRVDQKLQKLKLTKNEYNKHGNISPNTITNRFGSWHSALCAAGLEHRSNNRIPTEKLINQFSKELSENEILIELKNIAQSLYKTTISMEDLNTHSKLISGSTITKRFGSWKKGLELAGLYVNSHGKRYTDKECHDNLLMVWTYYGRQPTLNEMKNNPSKVGPQAYTARWGSWGKSLEAFIHEVDKGSESPNIEVINSNKNSKNEVKKNIKKEDRREIPLGLRYKVFNRDKFKCILCGDHPASNPKCKLEVDHIVPFSKGGKTKIENLRTLCKECNRGKGNKIEK